MTVFNYWFFDDAFSEDDCDALIKYYDSPTFNKQSGDIANYDVNKNVRDVEKVDLPVHKELGGILTAAGISANHSAWKFNIKRSNQCEFLKYGINGKYEPHLDTILNPNDEECRKLTTLLFLNDDFEGGKFYLQSDYFKSYPPQKKGTILVFPSFILHGVEPVTKGIRYTAVNWLVGPWWS